MRDVVVIGGGLSGLAAAYELEKRGIPYTLIEVKKRLGGSIGTEHHAGFALDSGPMVHPISDLPALAETLTMLGLEDAIQQVKPRNPMSVDENAPHFVFKQGTGVLIDALEKRITAPKLMRMAVSTLGQLDATHFAICMENGMVLDARALIVAAPARYAERMFHTLAQEISFLLVDTRYDSIARVSLGYRQEDVPPLPTEPPIDYPISYFQTTTHKNRVLPGGILIQAGIRYDPAKGLSPDAAGELAALMGWPLNPLAERVTNWPEADSMMWLDDDHPARLSAIRHLLPEGVALAGSDYVAADHPARLDERLAQGREAALRVAAWLGAV